MSPSIIKKFGRSVLSHIQPNNYLLEKKLNTSSFWTFFEAWMKAAPNSLEELAYSKNIQRALGYNAYNKIELLVAFHILQDNIPLKEFLLNKILQFKELSNEEWAETAAIAREAVIEEWIETAAAAMVRR